MLAAESVCESDETQPAAAAAAAAAADDEHADASTSQPVITDHPHDQ